MENTFKPITYKDYQFFYKIVTVLRQIGSDSEGCTEYLREKYTAFYKSCKPVTRRRWLWFKEYTEYEGVEFQFSIDMDIEDPKYSKSQIQTAMDKEIGILNRKQEIEKGEIV